MLKEVEALLAEDAGAENFLERPALEAVAKVLAKTRVSGQAVRQNSEQDHSKHTPTKRTSSYARLK